MEVRNMKSEKRKTERKRPYVKPKVIATYHKKELEENIKADELYNKEIFTTRY